MPNLTKRTNLIISASATPTTAEINAQFTAKTVSVEVESLATEESGRLANGLMNLGWILDRTRKVNVELKPDTPENLYAILNAVQGRVYYLTFWDPWTNAEMTRKMYTSNSDVEWYNGTLFSGKGLLQQARFSAIEMGGELNGVVIQ